ncbi:DNA repair exonuclease SbcCD nuclease subunit [Methanofollis sp. W23]|uniref:metallophosphoesterase family protein n=1 Tax=Methanofollis sp. W23 TaxID=2817849 RepID=UPI001AE2782A|nr:DNA repair exonuclease SbcCD nuclease subunit [Methanofollis sp. W23]
MINVLKFLHTSDWQMGMKAVHTGTKAKEVREKRFETAQHIVELAHQEDVDFVVLAGDTFEDHNVDDLVVKRTVDILNQFAPIPVYVLPGNHDPWIPGGVWERDSWERIGPHVTLLTENEEYCHSDDVVLYPCPLTQKQSGLDPTAWIPRRDEGDTHIRIGIAHGSLDLFADDAKNFPIARDRADQCDLDYLALGHWHSFQQSGRAVYSGTMEPTSFRERDPGNVVLVGLKEARAQPQIETQKINALQWVEITPDIHTVEDVESLDAQIRDLGPLASVLLKISPILEECTDSDALQRLDTLQKEMQERAFYLEWAEPVCRTYIGEASAQLPDGILSQVDEALAAIEDERIPDGPGRQFADQDLEIVRTARNLLHRLAGGRSA